MKERVLLLIVSLCLAAGVLQAQTKQVEGIVTSAEDGQPVIGASVLVKGASQGTITDVDGKFVLNGVPASAKMLVISFVGMKAREVAIAPRVEVVLESDQQVLDEVLVTVAYGTAKSPLGPIQVASDPIVTLQDPELEIYGPAHNSVICKPGTDEWYIVYHRINKHYLDKSLSPGTHREVCIDRLEFNEDGTIKRVKLTK